MDDKSPITSVIILEGSETMEERRLRWVLQAYLKETELRLGQVLISKKKRGINKQTEWSPHGVSPDLTFLQLC